MTDVSLCMIVRDEAAHLERCVESARGAFDELCIVDTGSADATPAIARRLADRFAQVPWRDSFADARNASLALASGRWILVLDADEVLCRGAAPVVRSVATRAAGTPDGTLGAHASIVDRGRRGDQRAWALRLFANAPDHRYVGAIHERLGPAFDARAETDGGHLLLRDDFEIEHHGYAPEIWQRKDKTQRTQRLFERALREAPDDLWLRYKHADFARGHGAPGEALALLDTLCRAIAERPIAEQQRYAWYAECFAIHASELLARGRRSEAGATLARAAHCPATANLLFVRGQHALETRRWSDALQHFSACRAVAGPARIQAPAPGVTTWRSALGLVEALRGAGRHGDAETLRADALAAYPDAGEALRAGKPGERASASATSRA